MPESQIRFKFVKVGEFKYLSHLDITRFIIRALARADIKVRYSQGFNPKPKINFSQPTPLGVESYAEYSDVMLAGDLKPADFMQKLNAQLRSQLRVLEAKQIKEKVKSLMAEIGVVLYSFKLGIPQGDSNSWECLSSELNSIRDIKNSIYCLDIRAGGKNFSLLKLYGYAKILKNHNNGIFKYNYFYDYFTDMARKYNIDIYSVAKEEMFVIRGNALKQPMEII